MSDVLRLTMTISQSVGPGSIKQRPSISKAALHDSYDRSILK